MHTIFAPSPVAISPSPAPTGEGKKSLSRKREREGAHPEGMGRVGECRMSPPSLTLPRPYGRGPLPLPQAGEGLIASGDGAKMCAPLVRESALRSPRGDRGREDVAGTAHRLDQLRLAGVALDLAAQPRHLGVDAAVESRPAAPLDEIEKLVATKHPVGIAREDAQELELARGERHASARGRLQLPSREVELPAEEA